MTDSVNRDIALLSSILLRRKRRLPTRSNDSRTIERIASGYLADPHNPPLPRNQDMRCAALIDWLMDNLAPLRCPPLGSDEQPA